MFEYLQQTLSDQGLAPHGYCLLWEPRLIWTHVVADALIGLAYFSIPIVLARFLTKRRDVQFGFVVWMFAAFIMACGATHFISILTLWVPAYGFEGGVKAATAAVSVVTAAALWPLLPKALALPSPAQLQRANDELRGLVEERDRALADLSRASAERARAEEMLRQSQKMEAVGQLTSGVAHDFNNLLTIVLGNLDRAARMVAEHPQLASAIGNATQGAERAAKLTDQLLAFARKQPLRPEAHDLSALVRDMDELLRRSVGNHVEVRLDLAEGLPPVKVDRNQTENAILNLAINARDAMPAGGTLRLTTGLEDGQVTLTVRDAGDGMTPEVLARAVEPFFTTKPLGEGTGLGLSQVYGFVKQSRGDMELASAPGEGTTVLLRFPATG
jgi:signal transduction histidine kinase